jgi:hypothetical protein
MNTLHLYITHAMRSMSNVYDTAHSWEAFTGEASGANTVR